MVVRDANGVTLHYIDPNSGQPMIAGLDNPALYMKVEQAMSDQGSDAAANQQALSNYNAAVAAYNASVAAGRPPASAPVAPEMLVHDDLDNDSRQPFPSNSLLPVATATPATPSGFAGISPTSDSDILAYLFKKITQIAAKMGV